MNMLTETLYRKIDKEFLNKTKKQSFNVFVKTWEGGTEKFVLFADRSLKQQNRLKDLWRSGTLEQDLYIDINEQREYLQQVAEHLKSISTDPQIPKKNIIHKLYSASHEIIQSIYDHGFSNAMLDSSEVVIETVKSIFSERDFKFKKLATMLANDMEAYTHSINTTFYCLALGKQLNLDSKDLYNLAIGAMFHDIGLISVPKEVMATRGLFHDMGTLPAFLANLARKYNEEPLKNHPLQGREILARLNRYSQEVLDIVEQHHESYDGSGYPHKLSGNKISYLARICKVADSYDTLRNPRFYRKKVYEPYPALELMVKDLKGQFDPPVLKAFIVLMGS